MIKPWLTSIGLLILLLLPVPVVPAYAASGTQTLPAKDYSADRFDAQITVQNGQEPPPRRRRLAKRLAQRKFLSTGQG